MFKTKQKREQVRKEIKHIIERTRREIGLA